MILIVTPLSYIGEFIFKYLLVNLYKLYRSLKTWLIKFFSPAKNKFFFLFSTRALTHILLIVIAVLVTTNSFSAKESRAEEFGQDSLIASLLQTDQQGEIVETSDIQTTKETSYFNKAGVVTTSQSVQPIENTEEGNEMSITTESGGALIKPNITITTKGSPRDKVEYYIVEGGDTISTIAEKFNVSTNTILWENKLGPRDFIKPGDKLTILPSSGVSHQVKKGDTLEKIAQKYGIDGETILEYNKLADADAISIDDILIIPGGEMPEPSLPTQQKTSTRYGLFNIPPPARVPAGARLLWPTASKKINQYFRWGHAGIDIDGDYSSPVYAAESGRIVTSGGQGRGYGNHIAIDHGDGKRTLYAHLSKMFVRVGDSVKKGQTIGMIGCTGWCTGPHLHFEVFINGKKVNPLSYL